MPWASERQVEGLFSVRTGPSDTTLGAAARFGWVPEHVGIAITVAVGGGLGVARGGGKRYALEFVGRQRSKVGFVELFGGPVLASLPWEMFNESPLASLLPYGTSHVGAGAGLGAGLFVTPALAVEARLSQFVDLLHTGGSEQWIWDPGMAKETTVTISVVWFIPSSG